jgi:putative endonuclease
MPSEKRQFGDIGEELATQYLKQKGYKILERNWRQKWGELDIVAAKVSGIFLSKIKEIVFAEVKTVKDGDTAFAAQKVHRWKQERLIRTAQTYLAKNNLSSLPWRIDVLLVDFDPQTNAPKIEHLENAVWGK